jgi:hypothetical protein
MDGLRRRRDCIIWDYNPATGGWVEEDPDLYVDGSSLYQFTESNPINDIDPYGLDGHHIIPNQVRRDNIDDLSPDAQKVFKDNTTGDIPGGHGWSKEHSDYNKAVDDELQKYIEEKGICPNNPMTKEQAEDFLKQIKNSDRPEIKNFLDDIAQKQGSGGSSNNNQQNGGDEGQGGSSGSGNSPSNGPGPTPDGGGNGNAPSSSGNSGPSTGSGGAGPGSGGNSAPPPPTDAPTPPPASDPGAAETAEAAEAAEAVEAEEALEIALIIIAL